LASGSDDKTIRLWNVATRQPFGPPLTGHTKTVVSVAFSADGKLLASGSDDTSVRLWDVATRQPLGPALTGHTRSVESVAFSADGKLLTSGSDDKTLRSWDVSFDSWQARACRIANRNFTRTEWEQYIGDIEPYRATCPRLPLEEKAAVEANPSKTCKATRVRSTRRRSSLGGTRIVTVSTDNTAVLH
jgi:WD40 repeat protein